MPNELIITHHTPPAVTAGAITAELGREFINFIDATPQSIATYRASLRRFFDYITAAQITAPTRADILAYRDELKQNYKPTTVSLHMTAARLFFRWTAQQGIYPNIADHIKGAKLDRGHKKDYLTSEQMRAIMQNINRATIEGKRDFAILAVMTTGGLRCVEINRADIEDLRTIGDETALYIQGKGREEKTDYIKLPAVVENALREYLTARGKIADTAPLFVSHSNNSAGRRLTTRSISRLVKNHMRGAGFDSSRLTAHSLRHTCATLNLLNGGTPQETQQLLRHSNINTTMIYSHALERANNNSENRIAGAIF